MSAELSIAIKIGASVGAAMAGLRSLLSGSRDLSRSTAVLQKEYDQLGRSIVKASEQGRGGIERMQRQQQQLAQLTAQMHVNQSRQGKTENHLAAHRALREDLRSQALGAFASVGAVLVPIKAAVDFESSMADVRKVVDFDTPQQLKQMEQDLLNMTHRIPMAGRELAAIAASGGQLGIARQDIAGFTETIAKMSVAFDMSAEQAGDSMAKLANVYQIPIAQIGRLGDAINHLSNNSPAKASDIVNALGRVGGVAKQFGLSELQTASLANAFISLGKTPEIAGTAINGMLTRLMTADKQGGKFQATLQAMGISAQQLKRDIAQNGEQALLDFLAKINQLPKDGQMGALVDLFGLEYADDVAVLAGSLDTYRQSIDALKQTDASGGLKFLGSMEKEFAARSATTANNWQLFKNQMAHLAINIGSVMLPAINDLLASLKPLIEQFIQFAQAHPTLIKNIFLALTALVAFKAGGLAVRFGLSLLSSMVWGANGKILALSASLLRVKSAMALFSMGRGMAAMKILGLNATQGKVALMWLGQAARFATLGWRAMGLAMLTNPLTWIVLAIVAAAALIYVYWKPIKAFFIGFWQGLQDGIAPVLPLLEMIGAGWKGLFDLAMAFLQPIIAWFRELGLVSDETAQKSQNMGYLFGVILGSLIGGITTVGSMIINGWRMIVGGLVAIIGAAWAQIKAAFNGGLLGILALILNWSPIGAFYSAFAAVLSWFGITLPAQFTGFGGMLIDGLINGIRAKIASAVATIQNLGARIKGAFTGAMQIHSPSRVFRSYGGHITEGLAIGMNHGSAQPLSRIGQLAGSLKSRFAERMGGFRSDLSARLSANADTLSQARAEHATQAAMGANGAITIHFNPTINAAGGNPQQIETALQMGLREFETLFHRMIAEQARRAY